VRDATAPHFAAMRARGEEPLARGLESVAGVTPLRLRDPKGGDTWEWPPDLRVRQFPDGRA